MRSLVVAVLSLLLLSCAVGPDYERPTTTTPDSFRMAEKGEDATSIANLSWWELLQD